MMLYMDIESLLSAPAWGLFVRGMHREAPNVVGVNWSAALGRALECGIVLASHTNHQYVWHVGVQKCDTLHFLSAPHTIP